MAGDKVEYKFPLERGIAGFAAMVLTMLAIWMADTAAASSTSIEVLKEQIITLRRDVDRHTTLIDNLSRPK